MKTWQWLVRNTRVQLGALPYREFYNADNQRSSHISKKWNTRVYPGRITPPLLIHTRPMMSRMSPQDARNVELSVAAVTGETVEFSVFLVRSPDRANDGLPFVSFLREPLEVIQGLYPSAVQLAPLLGVVDAGGARLVLSEERPDEISLGQAFSQWLRARGERAAFTSEALAKAETLLRRACIRHGFNIGGDNVTRGAISISRKDGAFTINGSFRCLTSDYKTPRDDQVVQKLLAITSKQSLDLISTLSARDRTLILNELVSFSC